MSATYQRRRTINRLRCTLVHLLAENERLRGELNRVRHELARLRRHLRVAG